MSRTDRILRALAKIWTLDGRADEIRAKSELFAGLLRLGSLEDTFRNAMIHGLGGEVRPPDPATLRQNAAALRRLVRWLNHNSTGQDELREEIDQLTEAQQQELLTNIETLTRCQRDVQKMLRIKQSSGSLAGRKPVDAAKELAVCRRVDFLVKKEHLPKAQVVQQAAGEFGLSTRKVWAILSEARAKAMTGYVTTEPNSSGQANRMLGVSQAKGARAETGLGAFDGDAPPKFLIHGFVYDGHAPFGNLAQDAKAALQQFSGLESGIEQVQGAERLQPGILPCAPPAEHNQGPGGLPR